MCRVLAVVNAKGGVAKTTTTLNLAAALSDRGRKVLAVDLDPQASLTLYLGFQPARMTTTIKDALDKSAIGLASILQYTQEKFQLVPANHELTKTAEQLVKEGRISAVRAALEPIRDRYDYVLLDCPPDLGAFTGAALLAADEVIIPFTADYLTLESLRWLMFIIKEVRDTLNPNLRVGGIFYTMHDSRTRVARDFADAAREAFSTEVPIFSARAKPSVSFKEAAAIHKSILQFAPDSEGAAAYRALAQEIDEGIRETPENELYFALERGQEALAKKDLQSAYAAFCHATEMRPKLAGAWALRAESATDWDEKIRCYGRSVQLEPVRQAFRASLEKCVDEGISHEGCASIPAIVSCAHYLESVALISHAERLYRYVTDFDPQHEEAWLGLARCTANPKDAAIYVRRCLTLNPDSLLAKHALETVNERLKAEAMRLVEKGLLQLQLGNREQAHSLFVSAIQFDPKNESALMGAAKTAGNSHASLSLVKHVLRINPENAEAREMLFLLTPPETLKHARSMSWRSLLPSF